MSFLWYWDIHFDWNLVKKENKTYISKLKIDFQSKTKNAR